MQATTSVFGRFPGAIFTVHNVALCKPVKNFFGDRVVAAGAPLLLPGVRAVAAAKLQPQRTPVILTREL